MPMMRLAGRLAAAALALCAATAQADSYRVDLIIYLDKHAGGEAGSAPRTPPPGLEVQHSAALAAAGIRLLPESDFALQEQWNRLRNAARFQPLVRLAWVQKDPPAERGPALQIRHGQSLTVNDPQTYESRLLAPVQGSVALLLGRYLHLDADLAYTAPADSGYRQYNLTERRRMRRNELHHLDSPKLGLLARVVRVDG